MEKPLGQPVIVVGSPRQSQERLRVMLAAMGAGVRSDGLVAIGAPEQPRFERLEKLPLRRLPRGRLNPRPPVESTNPIGRARCLKKGHRGKPGNTDPAVTCSRCE